jgi:phosphoenolpyruvate carboxykinase (ATP)
MNYVLPDMGIFPMHCSANCGKAGDTALLFGLSGTGKTTLSADPDRLLIGDDEHAWTKDGVSNFEDGCYAKLINLDKKAEPIIAEAMSMDGSVIENVPPLPNKPYEETDPQELDLTNNAITENTRISYPLDANPNVAPGAKGPHPKTIVLLTADAYGVLPPVCVLDADEVMYHFVQGFTSRLAGTEIGVKEPQPIFSACYGAPFMVHKVNVYADLLSKYMKEYKTNCIMLNTGWSGGAYGTGSRISIHDTRNLLNAALAGDFNAAGVEYETHPIFNMRYPKSCKGVNESILNPRNTWADKADYDKTATMLRDMFRKNFNDKGFASLGIEAKM